MKRTWRRWLSALLAAMLLVTMAPTALMEELENAPLGAEAQIFEEAADSAEDVVYSEAAEPDVGLATDAGNSDLEIDLSEFDEDETQEPLDVAQDQEVDGMEDEEAEPVELDEYALGEEEEEVEEESESSLERYYACIIVDDAPVYTDRETEESSYELPIDAVVLVLEKDSLWARIAFNTGEGIKEGYIAITALERLTEEEVVSYICDIADTEGVRLFEDDINWPLRLLDNRVYCVNSPDAQVMTAQEFVNCLKIALSRNTTYNNNYPYNVGYYNGSTISWDCWNLGKSILWSRGTIVNNYTVGSYSRIDTSFGLGDWDGLTIIQRAPNCNSDFSNLVPGEWLYMSGHIGYYVGDGQVIECTTGWGANGVTQSQINSSGVRSRNGARNGTWLYHGMVPWIDYGNNPVPTTDYDTLQFIDVVYPKTFKIDTRNGWFLQGGTLASNVALTSLKSELLTNNGSLVSVHGPISISGKSYTVRAIDSGVKFNQITGTGNYIWRLTAMDSAGRTLSMDMPFTAVSSGTTSTASMSKKYEEPSHVPEASTGQGQSLSNANARVIYSYLKNNMSLNDAACAGVLANIEKESNFKPTSSYQETDSAGNHFESYGICQWNRGRLDALKNYCASIGYSYASLEGQIRYFEHEIKTNNYYRPVYDRLCSVENTEAGAYEAGVVFCNKFEVPYDPNGSVAVSRGNLAINYFSRIHPVPVPESNTLQFFNVVYPKTFKIDTRNGWFLQGGTVSSNVALTSLKSELLTSNGSLVSVYGPISISGKSYAVRNIDSGVRFDLIRNAGNYIWRLTATDSAGRTLSMDMPFTAVSSGSTSTASMSKPYPTDTSKPTISNIRISNVSSSGYTVTCNVSDNVGVTQVKFPTWTWQNDQDDLIWHVGTLSGNTASYTVRVSDHRNETGVYITHIYAYDAAGNYSSDGTSVEVPTPTISVIGVSLNKTSLSMNVGSTDTLTATVTPANATNKAVTWSSSNANVATVDSNGRVTARAAGMATITVRTIDGGKTATCNLTVVNPTVSVTGVSLNKTSLSMSVGSAETLIVTVAPGNATDKAVSWFSSNTNVATVDASGKVTAKAAGTATITVRTNDGGKTATCAVTVIVPVTGVSLDKTSFILERGATAALIATITPANASNKAVTWSSSNTGVATVDSNGEVTAKAAGTATITVKTADGGKTATCRIIVPEVGVAINASHFPDAEFRDYVQTNFDDNADNVLSNSEIAAVSEMYLNYGSISSLKGIEYFTELTELDCSHNNITSFDISKNTKLVILDCVESGLTSLDVSKNTRLEELSCDSNELTALDVSKNTKLSYFSCFNNKLMSLKLGTHDRLKALDCCENRLNRLDISGCPRLIKVYKPENFDYDLVLSSRTECYTDSDAFFEFDRSTTVITAESIPVTGISLNKTALSLNAGGTATLTATVAPSNATNKAVAWSSSNVGVATVDDSGKVTARAVGTATITVKTSDGGKTASCAVTVAPVYASSVTLNQSALSLYAGDTYALVATVAPVNATDKTVTWSSSNAGVATVDDSGRVTAKAAGAATITATTANGKAAACAVQVSKRPKPKSVKLDKTGTVKLGLGSTLTLTATVSPANADATLKWSSSNKKIATVEDGVITPVKTGTATITVKTVNGKKAKVKVKITDPTLPKAVKINPPASTTLWKGAKLTLTATLTPSVTGVAPVSVLTWKSSNTKIVSVDKSTGALTAKKPGKATITVTTRNKKSAKLKLTVIDPNAPTGVTIAQGASATLSLSGSKTLQLTATAQCPSGNPSTTYKWTTSNKKIATVSKTGLVTAKKAGKVKITVTTANKKKATITVTVTK